MRSAASELHPDAEYRQGRQAADRAAVAEIGAVSDFFGVRSIGDVLDVERDFQQRPLPLPGAIESQVELKEIWQTGAVLRAEYGIVAVVARIIKGVYNG